jgi:ethanolamine-phosphate cytidylyltransferase
MNVHERVLNVLSCVHVDEVVIGAPFQVSPDLLKTLNVSLVARAPPSAQTKKRALGLPRPVPDPCGRIQQLVEVREVHAASSLGTDDVIQRILDNRQMYEARNQKKAAKDDAYAVKKAYVAEV